MARKCFKLKISHEKIQSFKPVNSECCRIMYNETFPRLDFFNVYTRLIDVSTVSKWNKTDLSVYYYL